MATTEKGRFERGVENLTRRFGRKVGKGLDSMLDTAQEAVTTGIDNVKGMLQ